MIVLAPSPEYDGPEAPVQCAHAYQVLSPMLARAARAAGAAGSTSSSGEASSSSSIGAPAGPPRRGRRFTLRPARELQVTDLPATARFTGWQLDPGSSGSTGPLFNLMHERAANLESYDHRTEAAAGAVVVGQAAALASRAAPGELRSGSHWVQGQPHMLLAVKQDIACGEEIGWDYKARDDGEPGSQRECFCPGVPYRHLMYRDAHGMIQGVVQPVKMTRAAARAAAQEQAATAAVASSGCSGDAGMGMVALHAFVKQTARDATFVQRASPRVVAAGGVHTPVRAISGKVFPYVGHMRPVQQAAGR